MKYSNAYLILLSLTNSIQWINCDLTKEQLLTEDLPLRGFGKYMVSMRNVGECVKWEEPVDVENRISSNVNSIKQNETDEEITGYLVVPKNFQCVKAKITPSMVKDGTLRTTLNKTTLNPCTDLILSVPIKMFMKSDNHCNIKKGNFSLDGLNINKWTHLLTGENFVYARLLITLEYFSSIGSAFCIFAAVDIKPIPKLKKNKIKPRTKPQRA